MKQQRNPETDREFRKANLELDGHITPLFRQNRDLPIPPPKTKSVAYGIDKMNE